MSEDQIVKDNERLKEELARAREREQRYIEKIVGLESMVRDFREIAVNLSNALVVGRK